jgi:hypothetical protein
MRYLTGNYLTRFFHATGGVVVRLLLSAHATSGAGLIHEKIMV